MLKHLLHEKATILLTFFIICLSLYGHHQLTRYENYPQLIAQIESVSEQKTKTETVQTIKVKGLNHQIKEKTLTLKQTVPISQINGTRYRPNQKLFLRENQSSYTIQGLKRDLTIWRILIGFAILLIWLLKKQGLFTLISVIANLVLITLIVRDYVAQPTANLVSYFMMAIIPLTIVSLVLTNGWQKKTYTAILATLSGTFVSFLMGWLLLNLTHFNGLRFEEMGFITRSPQQIFLASLLIGCLGAVMDVAMTVVASLYELKEQTPHLSRAAVKQSGKQIGQDIMGPMTNVLFFSYISGAIPMMLIFLLNHLTLPHTWDMLLTLEVARAFIGGIGIILTIPISIHFSLFFLFKKGGQAG